MSNIPSIAMIPSAYKSGKVYSVLPSDGSADLNFARASEATRVNQNGLIEKVGSNVPRIDYTDGGCPKLLLEPLSTNLITHSEDFSNAVFNAFRGVVNINVITSPKGDLTADEFIEDNTSNTHVLRYTSSTLTTASYSVFAKSKGGNRGLRLNASTDIDYVDFDIDNGTKVQEVGNAIGSIIDYGNGWFRCSVTVSSASGTSWDIRLLNAGTDNYLGDNTSGIYIWGAQLEQKSYATSYIPTNGSTVTRNAETCTGSGDANTFNDSEGVLFGEVNFLSPSDTSLLEINDGSANNRVSIYSDSGVLSVNAFNGASNTLTSPSTDILNYNKVVISYKLNEVKMYVNGILIGTDNVFSGFSASLSNMETSLSGGAIPFYGNVKQIQYFDTALTDTDLEELTSWTSFNEMAQSQLYKTY